MDLVDPTVRDGDATRRPVADIYGVDPWPRATVKKDVLTRRTALRLRSSEICLIRTGNPDGEVKAAFGILLIDQASALRRAAVSLELLVVFGREGQSAQQQEPPWNSGILHGSTPLMRGLINLDRCSSAHIGSVSVRLRAFRHLLAHRFSA